MKILHKSKRAVPPPPPVAELIAKLQNTPNEELPKTLGDIVVWKWQRSDLNAWIKVLNKFDAILEELIRDYTIDMLQISPFTPESRSLLAEILRFERLLLENSTNRKMFNSYDRLNSLLFTSDLDILILTLKLVLRPSQQYSAQPSVSQALNISTPRLQSLAKRWPHLREYGVGLVDLSVGKDSSDVEALPVEAREVHFTYYRTDAGSSSEKMFKKHLASQAKTAPPGAVSIHIDESTLQSKPEMEILADAIENYSVPDSEKFELLCRIRAAVVLMKGKEDDREKLVIIRLLAIAIFGHTHPEAQATSSIFLYEPDLITHVAELLQVDKDIPIAVQTAAISALDALARYRSKIQEVLTSVNAGVNHGILMGLLRKTVADIANPESSVPNSFAEALLSFILENRLPNRLSVLSKTMQLVDNVLYSFTNAFNLFCTSRGVDALVERIEFEISFNVKEHGDHQKSREIYGSHSEIPVARAAVLKHILRSMHRMMQSSGTSEGLRGLIDTSILKSIKKIIEYRGLFGASVLPIAINIMATFVHNEPTSLAVIQEAGLPEAFYKAIELGLEPAIEVIQAIPNAIGALCLNEVGQAQLTARPSIIPSIFSIFTSDRHLKVLLEKENAVLIGTAIDELVRHHPILKGPVFDSLRATLSKIEDLGNAFEPPEEAKQWYKLLAVPTVEPSDDDVPMEDVQTAAQASTSATRTSEDKKHSSPAEEGAQKAHDNHIVSFIDVLGRFLEGLFQHTPHCRDFLSSTDGLASLGRLTALPCLPYDFANSLASDSMVQVMRTMTEVATSETLLHLAKLVKESLDLTQTFWGTLEDKSKLLQFVDLTSEEEVNANYYFRNLVTLHVRITLLSDVFATAGYAHGRAAIGLLQTLMSNNAPRVVKDLGALHRTSIWENIVLKVGLSAKGIDVLQTPSLSPLERSPDQLAIGLPDTAGPAPSAATNGTVDGAQSGAPPSTTKEPEIPKAGSPREHNATALKHLTHGLPSSLAPFFQAMVKMFHARRTPDPAQKKQMAESSAVVADILLKHLNVENLGDKTSTFAYYAIILGLMTMLLVDERTTTSTLHTVQVLAFYRAGGLEAVFEVCRSFTSSIESIASIKEEVRSEAEASELSHAYGGLKVALHLVHPLISSKPLFDSGQTALLVSRDVRESEPEYFEPHNFLVRLRTACLPFLRGIWEAPWLIQAPLFVSRFVVQSVLELINGDSEETKGESELGPLPTGITRPSGLDENRIRQLTDMGFPRSAAERALTRTHNNVNAATELLLAHPFPFPPDPEPTARPASAEIPAPTAQSDDSSPAPESSDAASTPLPETPTGKTNEEWQKELNEAREPLKAGISRQALLLVDEHLSLIFDLHVAFIRPSSVHQRKAVQDLVDDIKSFSPYAYDVQEQPLANRCRLLALVLCETPSSLSPELRTTLMDSLLALLLSNPVSINPDHPSIPRWLAAHLLVTEALFTLADEPRSITVPKEGEPVVPEGISTGPPLTEARTIVFDFCMRLLAIPDLPSDELLSTLRLLVLLTRDHTVASHFVSRDGLDMLFRRLRASAVNGSSSYIATILRHLVEDVSVVNKIMHQSIKRYFTQLRGRLSEPSMYVRNCSAMGLRNSELFIEATKSLCQLSSPYSPNPHLSLRGDVVDDKAVASVDADMQVDGHAAAHAKPSDSAAATVHFLIGELIATSRTTVEKEEAEQKANDSTELSSSDAKDKTQYMCFLMQCLTELLFSYDACKFAFLSYSSKKSRSHGKEAVNKSRTATLNFFLSDLIAYETINPQPDADCRQRMQVCNWAMSVLVALCVDSSSTHEPKDVPSSLVSVRKTVLDAIGKSIKDLPASDNLEARYGRLLALADLCHRLLTVRFNNSASRKQHDEGPTHMAKVMLEKNFVSTLTSALSEVDLNYPNVRGLVISILRPLEHLTKIAIKMSRTTSKGRDVIDEVKAESVVSMDSDDSDGPEETREETPDLYRNSALGIYGGEMEDVHFNGEDDIHEDDDDDEDDDEEMDFADETGSEDTSNTADEGDDDDLEEQVPHGDGWEQDEDEDEEDLVHNEDEDDNDEEDDDENDRGDDIEGAEGDEEMIWQDIHGVNADAGGDDGDDEDEVAGPIQIIHEDDEDEPEMVSDDEEFGQDMELEGHDFVGDIFGFSDNINDGAGVFVPRRHRSSADDNVQVFGRARNGAAPPPEATTHPLLLDASTGNRSLTSQSRLSRQQPRIIADGNNELLQTIEQLVGGGAVQLFHHIMTRGRGGGGPETIRLDVPSGTLMNLDRGYLQRRAGPVISASVRVERGSRPNQGNARDLDPLLTLQRWTEEVKILHGEFVAERVGKLANHITVALLPAAIEAAKQAKIREEELAREREAQAKAEAADKEAKEKMEQAANEEAGKQTTPPQSQSTSEDLFQSVAVPVVGQEDHPMDDANPTIDTDTEMIDGTTQAPSAPEGNADPGDASSSQVEAPARVTVLINGSVVDITDTGIDPTFLEALPDDMREEVLNQHVRDQRAARIERPPDSQISAEFLDALPPELRAEIIQQEAVERSRRRAEGAEPQATGPGPVDIDPASFIASLDPTLRQAILLDQDDGFIQSLPSHMIAEAGVYRDHQPRRFHIGSNSSLRPTLGSSAPRKFSPQHDAIQLLDRQGIAILVRLLFFPQVLRKSLLFKVLVNLCENAKTRTELFNLLLNILQDGTGDLSAVDKSFAQMSFRNSKPQKALGKQKSGSDFVTALTLPNVPNEAIPDLIAQRCLDALVYIVTANQMASLFFLTEHEVPAGLRKAASKKGKGKEKQMPQSHYPIVLLLGLLDRQSLLRTPSIVESVVSLLATVTRPLSSIKENKKLSDSAAEPQVQPSQSQLSETVEGTTEVTNLAPSGAGTSEAIPEPSTSTGVGKDKSLSIEAVEEKILLANPPQIPHGVLRFIVNILTVGECSARTFQQSLALIQHLSNIPDARDVIAQELKSKAQEFGQNLLADLDELVAALLSAQGDVMISSVASKFSAPSSTQAKLLRVLKTIDYMYSPRPSAANEGGNDTEKVQSIYESFRFAPLWKRLGDCLAVIEEKSDMEHVATVLLPLIEALMVVCKYVGPKASSSGTARALRATSSPKSPTTPSEAMEDLFVTFTDAHRKVLNVMVRNNPSLMSGSFSLLVHNPRVLDFDNKRNYFSQQLHRRPHTRDHHSTLQLNVRRARVFEDSFQHLQRKTGDQIKYGKLSIRFYDEEGVDAGGLTREWFQILARQMFDPNNALFQPCAADKLTYQPNKNSWVNPEHLSFFKFVGRVIGKAIYDGRLLDAYFARSLYRQLLGKPVDYKDVEWVDPEYYNSLCWILENDPTLLELTFSVEADEFGVNRIISLKDGGESIPVTQENKREFVQLSAQYRLYSSIKEQIENLLSGFYEIIPKDLVTIFNEQELELLISGTPDIDVDEWRAATEYNGYTSSDPNIVWWWRALKSFNRDERAKVLSFATGTSRVPLNGFNDLQGVQGVQKFSIHRAYGESDRLPQAHTCFNQIDLPQYSSYEMLRQQVLLAISEGGEGFGFV
ncbi:uncharacterized protein EV420DRAFT_1746494 [Desarmillaria tabescens]|uniref:HECT-type E3 ubiquitin transferase n=1 Tax=Armillaria tabescens TaxID=1929756 RepID=A0AA39N8Q2_ARMTA|nr:uncharacterized protein EV420DRAFT_1746494 [Desarmillaria tabescens]KAK0461087.1 hypothetical protein EV420DRAFT_1746494 [Desarmillaria tabescens]